RRPRRREAQDARRGGHERVPTFARLLDLASSAPVELLPEIKVDANRQRYDSIEDKVLALLRARGLLARTTIQAFQVETIRRLRELEPKARTMLLVARGVVGRDRAGRRPRRPRAGARLRRATAALSAARLGRARPRGDLVDGRAVGPRGARRGPRGRRRDRRGRDHEPARDDDRVGARDGRSD